MEQSDRFTEEQEELLNQWKSVAQEHEGANHFHFSQHYNPDDARSKAESFISEPSEENFTLLWEQLNSAQRSGAPSVIYDKWQDNGRTDQELADLIEEIYTASEYHQEWESQLGAVKTLWELYGLLHIEEKPMLNNSVIAGLGFFGYAGPGNYEDGAETFREFSQQYRDFVGHVTSETDHQVPINLEIDQLFNVIHKVRESDPEKEAIEEAAQLYELVLGARDGTEDSPSPSGRSQQRGIWQITPGKGGDYWDTWREKEVASLGFEEVDSTDWADSTSDDLPPIISGEGMVYRLQNAIETGDIIIAKRGTKAKEKANIIYGIGVVTDSYYKSEALPIHHQRFIDVEWIETFGEDGLEITIDDSSDSIKSYTLDDLSEAYYQSLLLELDTELTHDRASLSNLPYEDRSPTIPDTLVDSSSETGYYWVNQTNTEEIQNEYLAASVDSVWHHDLTQLNRGDIVFHYHEQAVIGCSEVVEEATTVRTDEEERYRVTVDFERFDEPHYYEEIREYLQRDDVRGDRYYPLDKNGGVNQGYLGRLTEAAAEYLLPPQESNFFWVSANPSIWKVDNIADGGEIFYTAYNPKGNKRRIFGAFEQARPGDKVLFYESTPVKAVVAEGTITEGLHKEEHKKYTEPVDGIKIEYERPVEEISWEQLNAVPDIEDAAPIINRAQGSIFQLSAEDYETILALEDKDPELTDSSDTALETLREKLDPVEVDFEMPPTLFFEDPESLQSEIEASLNSGKHIIFTGPPGTGKTKLAKEICRQGVRDVPQVDDHTFTTATSEWTTFDTIGGYVPATSSETVGNELEFQPRLFLNCFRQARAGIVNQWLMIDEINRSDIDKAFGPLFSVLSGDSVELPYERQSQVEIASVDRNASEDELRRIASNSDIFPVTPSWRLLATMNTYDKASLYEMSYAFMRRFNFIHVGIPDLETDEGGVRTALLDPNRDDNYASAWLSGDKDLQPTLEAVYKEVTLIWKIINSYPRAIGPSIVRDILGFTEAYGVGDNPDRTRDALTAAIVGMVYPQLEGLRPDEQKKLVRELTSTDSDQTDITLEVNEQRLKNKAEDLFAIRFEDE